MKRGTGQLLVILAIAVGAGDLWARSPVVVQSGAVPTAYHHEYSTAQIESMSAIKAPSRAAHEPGLTLFEYEISSQYDLALRSRSPQGPYRFWVKTLNVQFKINRMDVYVSSQYPVGSCQYNAILAHENTHVSINQRLFRKYLGFLRSELARAALPTPGHPWTAASQDQAEAALDARIKPILKNVEARFAAEDRRENAKIDTPASYRRTSAKCKDW